VKKESLLGSFSCWCGNRANHCILPSPSRQAFTRYPAAFGEPRYIVSALRCHAKSRVWRPCTCLSSRFGSPYVGERRNTEELESKNQKRATAFATLVGIKRAHSTLAATTFSPLPQTRRLRVRRPLRPSPPLCFHPRQRQRRFRRLLALHARCISLHPNGSGIRQDVG